VQDWFNCCGYFNTTDIATGSKCLNADIRPCKELFLDAAIMQAKALGAVSLVLLLMQVSFLVSCFHNIIVFVYEFSHSHVD